MVAFAQRFLWCQRPVAFIVNDGRAQNLVTIINGHGIARFTFTAEYRTRFVSDVTAFQLTGNRTGIILSINHIRFCWRRSVNNDLNRIGRLADITQRIFLNHLNIVLTLAEIFLRRVSPFPFVVDDNRADLFIVIFDNDGIARRAFTTEGRLAVISYVAWLKGTRYRTRIVINFRRFCFPRGFGQNNEFTFI